MNHKYAKLILSDDTKGHVTGDDEFLDAFWTAVNALNDYWIPVTSELPKTDDIMLVTCKTKTGVLNVNRAYYSNGFWHGSGSMSGVIAWMPLPEPYTAESEDKDEDKSI